MIERYNYEGDTNIGFSATVTDNFVLVAPEFRRAQFFETEEVAETFTVGTRYPGLFTVGSGNRLLVPNSLKKRELDTLRKSSIDLHVLDSTETALGNLILANNQGALISERLEDERKEIEEALDVDTRVGKLAGIPNPGVVGAANKNGVLMHRDTTEDEAEVAKKVLGVEEAAIGTVNLGSPYIGSGLLCNSRHVLVGEDTSGPEIGRIDRTLQEHS